MDKIDIVALRKSGSLHFREYDANREVTYDVWVIKLFKVIFIVSKALLEALGYVNAFETLVCPLTRKVVRIRPISKNKRSREEFTIEKKATYICSEKYVCLNYECPLVDSKHFNVNLAKNLGSVSQEDLEYFIELVKLINIFIDEHYGEIEKEGEAVYLLDDVIGEER